MTTKEVQSANQDAANPQQGQDTSNSDANRAPPPIQIEQVLEHTKHIQCELEKLNNHKLVRTYNSIPRLLWFNLLKGVSLGLGSVLGATVVLSTLIYILSQMEFIPIIGEWITAILEVVQQEPEN